MLGSDSHFRFRSRDYAALTPKYGIASVDVLMLPPHPSVLWRAEFWKVFNSRWNQPSSLNKKTASASLQQPAMATHAVQELATLPSDMLFQQLEAYTWSSDNEFQNGLQAILRSNPSSSQEQAELLTLRARCFYFSR